MVAYTRNPGILTNYYSRTVSVDGDLGPELALDTNIGSFSTRAIAFAQPNFLVVWADRGGGSARFEIRDELYPVPVRRELSLQLMRVRL